MVKAADVEVCRHSFTYSFKNTHWNNVRYQWYTTRLRQLCAPPQLSCLDHLTYTKTSTSLIHINFHSRSFAIMQTPWLGNPTWSNLTSELYFDLGILLENLGTWLRHLLWELGNLCWEPWNLSEEPDPEAWKPYLIENLKILPRKFGMLLAKPWNLALKTWALRTVLILQVPRFQSKISGETVHKSGSQVPKHIQGEHALRWQQVSVVRR